MSSIDIMEMFERTKSQFVYHPGYDKTVVSNLAYDDPSKTIKILSKQEVQYLYDSNYFTDSDLQIANVVAKHVFATQGMIKKYIDYFHKVKTDMDAVPLISDMNSLKGRLQVLVKAGILSRYLFTVPHFLEADKEFQMSYYLVSPHGYNYLKRILNNGQSYDEYLGITPLDEVFKYLCVNIFCQSLLDIKNFKNYTIERSFYSNQSRKKHAIYGVIDMEKDSCKKKIIVEPFRINYNPNRFSINEFNNNLINRFNLIKEYGNMLMSKGEDYDVMFVCEDFEGLKKAAKFVSNRIPELQEKIYFSTDGMACFYKASSIFIKLKGNSLINSVPEYIE